MFVWPFRNGDGRRGLSAQGLLFTLLSLERVLQLLSDRVLWGAPQHQLHTGMAPEQVRDISGISIFLYFLLIALTYSKSISVPRGLYTFLSLLLTQTTHILYTSVSQTHILYTSLYTELHLLRQRSCSRPPYITRIYSSIH